MSDARRKTVIVTGASQGIGAGAAMAFLKLGYNVVANSSKISESGFAVDARLALVDGNIGQAATAAKIAATAVGRFGSIDGVVNSDGIFFSKRFTDYTSDDFDLLSASLPRPRSTPPMHNGESKEFLKGLFPMGEISDVDDVVHAIVYLSEARHVTGEILYVDAGARIGKW